MPRKGFHRSQVPKKCGFWMEIATVLVPRGLFQAGLTYIFPLAHSWMRLKSMISGMDLCSFGSAPLIHFAQVMNCAAVLS